MTHTFEFVAVIGNGETIRMFYKGQSSRHKKVKEKILEDLTKAYGIPKGHITEMYLKPVK